MSHYLGLNFRFSASFVLKNAKEKYFSEKNGGKNIWGTS